MKDFKPQHLILSAVIVGLVLLVWLSLKDLHPLQNPDVWQMAFQPGPLSQAHTSLSHDCTACHSPPTKGPTKVGCVSCHSANEMLLKRQSTAFHANITSCKECHREHQGGRRPPLVMDHDALAKLGMKQFLSEPDHTKKMRKDVTRLVRLNPHASPLASKLNCTTCHANQDKHQKFFGTSCVSCHSTESWKIAEYRHPSPNNRDCAQCHKAPPSHYMMHFEMVSKSVARKEHAQVSQCYLCHRTTSWNDIQGVGLYKHH